MAGFFIHDQCGDVPRTGPGLPINLHENKIASDGQIAEKVD